MNKLEKIQKTVKVFKIISLVAMILTYVGAGILLIFVIALTAIGEEQFSELWSSAMASGLSSQVGDSFAEVCAALWCDGVSGLFEGAILAAVFGYLKKELSDGTPFTEKGAVKLRKLGIKIIILPIVSAIICDTISSCYNVSASVNISNLTSLIFGIALIVISLIFSYGAELESKAKSVSADNENA